MALGATTPVSQVASSLAATPTPTATPAGQKPACDPSQSNFYCVYTVQPGDNLSTIASRFAIKGNEDVTPWELLVQSNKPDIVSEDAILDIGQKLRIPTQSGVIHTVLSAQTLGDIADIYDVNTKDIMAVSANGITSADNLRIGQELLIPSPRQFSKPAPPPPAPSRSGSGSGSSGSQSALTGPRSASGFMWPTSGPISSYFGPNHPLGIDVDLFSNPNAPIGAAAAGTVTFAGGNPCCSYGYYVVVDHGNGMSTLYAHFSRIAVSVGQKVSQGQILGNAGRTGYATGNHLHFEVHNGSSIVNPLSYLP